ncbi:MAG: hypothetical protein ACI8VC_000828 [Candidatus Endobugula sp.]|jgi:hypothetical protein
MLKKIYLLMSLSMIISYTYAQGIQQTAESSLPTTASDCTMVTLDNRADNMLTKAERIAQMDNALQDSIDKYDQCVGQVVTHNAASDAGAESAAEESESGEEGSSGNNSNNSNDNSGSAPNLDSITDQAISQRENKRESSSNGAKNQEIAPNDNDSAVCRLLKDELTVETDPKKQGELTEIYNNYNCRG